MARFARASGNEPLMKLERPTPASSQSTAHIINAAFSDVLSTKPHDAKAVNNLAISRRGESDYHDTFVDELTKVSEVYNQRLALLSQLERHLVQARAKGLADDEKAISSMTELCPTYGDLKLPRGPSQFRKHLDEELLARNHLLVPSKYTPTQPEHHNPPQETPPSYLNPTLASHKSSSVYTGNLITKSSKPVWQSTLSTEEREAEKIGLSNFNRKANYLRNSRYCKTKWSNTASSGPVKLKQQDLEQKDGASFVAEPEVVEFTDYSVGKTYETTLELKNISGVSRQLRLVPLTSPFFKVTPNHYPTEDGLVAPGLGATYTVTFTPDSLADYQDELKLLACNDEEISVQLRGFRPPPILNIPAVLEVGYCLAGGRKTHVLHCVNTGGEGTFTLAKLNSKWSKDETLPSELILGPFSLSPVQFHLPANEGVIPLTVSFAPDKGVGEYTEEFSMACDNEQVMSFTIRGVAQAVNIGCVCAGQKAPPKSFTIEGDHPVIGGTNEEEIVQTPSLEFDTVNPHGQSTATIVVKNFSNVELAYRWRFYRPITEGPPWKREDVDVPLINKLVSSDHTHFSVDPCNGTLVAKEARKFTFTHSPIKTGSTLDMCYLVLTGIETDEPLDKDQEETGWLRLSDSEVAILYVQLIGEAVDYSVDVCPPAWLIPYQLPLATDTRRSFKLNNASLSAVCYQWSTHECEVAAISVEPPHGYIDAGGYSDLEVCIQSKNKGSFSTLLTCSLENCDQIVTLPVSGLVEGPVVSVSVPLLDFGLVPVGRSNTVTFRVNSQTNCPLHFDIRQVIKGDRDGCIDLPCLTVSPSERELSPHGSALVSVDCTSSGTTGRLKTILKLLINGKPHLYLWALANLQRPQVFMSSCYLDMGKCYVGIESSRELELHNSSPVPAQFTWSSQVCGESVRVCVSPMTGRIGPHQTAVVTVQATWTETSPSAEAILCCEVLDMQRPLYIQLTAQVLGLSVSYSQPSSVDFASNKLGVPVSKTLTVTNTSGISATLEAQVINFPSAVAPTPPVQPKPEESSRMKSTRGRALLNRTANLLEKNNKQAASDQSDLLLREGRGCCFAVEPPSTSLPPFTPVTLTLTAYSDMWGEYTDQLICKIPGLDDAVVPVSYGAVGCPIVFQSTATVGQTLARLGAHTPGADPVRRMLKLKNTSPVAIRVDWQMYNIVQNDNKYVDLIMTIGDPFPPSSGLLGHTHQPVAPQPSDYGLISRSESYLLQSKKSLNLMPISSSESQLDQALSEEEPESTESIIGALIKPHEGVRSTHPFDIHPKQLVLPAHGVSAVEVVFQPSVKALNEMGPYLASYALGYMSLDTECPPNVTRKCGYDVEPLRVDILADIQHTRLSLQSDEDNGLDFIYPASVLLQDGSHTPSEECSLTHHFTLLNSTSTIAVFKLATLTHKFTVANVSLKKDPTSDSNQYITLKPQRSVSFEVSLTLSLDDVRQCANEESLKITDSLQVQYVTGALQEFPLTATISLPHLSLSTEALDFNTVHIDSRPAPDTLLLSNLTTSHAIWQLALSEGLKEVISLELDSGLLPLHLSGGKVSTELIRLEFSPRVEHSYCGVLQVRELITNRVLTVTLAGQGSADEKYVPSHT